MDTVQSTTIHKSLHNRYRNPHQVGDKVQFQDQIVMSRIKNNKANVVEIIREGTVLQIIEYGMISYLIIECHCVVDYGIFMKAHTLVEKCDE